MEARSAIGTFLGGRAAPRAPGLRPRGQCGHGPDVESLRLARRRQEPTVAGKQHDRPQLGRARWEELGLEPALHGLALFADREPFHLLTDRKDPLHGLEFWLQASFEVLVFLS